MLGNIASECVIRIWYVDVILFIFIMVSSKEKQYNNLNKNQKIERTSDMPELPEVETIRRVLEPQLQNRTIEKVTVNHKDAVAYPSVDDFCLGLTGQMVSHIQRRGKFLIICMKSGDRVILHLRMTGGLLFTPKNYPEEKYTHLIFHFDQGQKLLFSDMRRFGRFWFLKKEEQRLPATTFPGRKHLRENALLCFRFEMLIRK